MRDKTIRDVSGVCQTHCNGLSVDHKLRRKYGEALMTSILGHVKNIIHEDLDDALQNVTIGAQDVNNTLVDEDNINFFLFSSQFNGDPFDPNILSTRIKETSHMFILIHGWNQTMKSVHWYKPLTQLLLRKYPDAQIVQVDWEKPAADVYGRSAFTTESVAQVIAKVIQKLVQKDNVSLRNIVVIGHSLGAQIAGWVGKEYRKLTSSSLHRIIALDPAGPIFNVRPESRRLNDHDADIVMVILTDRPKFGFPWGCGTINFFPNNGMLQPGCLEINMTDFSLSRLNEPVWCSHRRAYDFFIEAIKQPQKFIGTECYNYKEYIDNKCDGNRQESMGNWQTTQTGNYYLQTTGKHPFSDN